MSILYIVNDLAYFRAHRENIAVAMAAKGHEVIVASGDWQNTDVSDWPSNMKLIPLELNKHALDINSDIKLVRKLRAIFKSERPDIIHAITIKPILMCSIATRLLRPNGNLPDFKMVWTFPGLGKIFEPTTSIVKSVRKFIVTRALKLSAKKFDISVTFENAEDRDILIKQLDLLPEKTHILFGAGISLKHFNNNAELRQAGDTRPVFLMATRLINEKGIDVFLEAAEALENHPARPRFVLAGTSDQTNPDRIDQTVIYKSVAAGHIEFCDSVALDEMPALYQKAIVFCLPTRLREGFPRSLIEAAACGCALIATDQKSIRQIIKLRSTGWLLQKPNRENLISAIKAALSDIQATIVMGTRAQELVVTMKASDEAIISNFEKIYNTTKRNI